MPSPADQMFSWTKSHQLKQRGVINVPRRHAWGFTVELWLKASPNQRCAANHRHNSKHLFYLDCWFPFQTNSIICNQHIINICKLLMGQMVCWCGILGQQWGGKKKIKGAVQTWTQVKWGYESIGPAADLRAAWLRISTLHWRRGRETVDLQKRPAASRYVQGKIN